MWKNFCVNLVPCLHERGTQKRKYYWTALRGMQQHRADHAWTLNHGGWLPPAQYFSPDFCSWWLRLQDELEIGSTASQMVKSLYWVTVWFWAAMLSTQFPLLRPGADGHLWCSQQWVVFRCTIHLPGFGCGGVSLALNVLVAGYGVVDLLCSTDLSTRWKWPVCHHCFFFLWNQHWAVCAPYRERELSPTHWSSQWLNWEVPE